MLHLCFAAGLRVSELVDSAENLSLQPRRAFECAAGSKGAVPATLKETATDLRPGWRVRGTMRFTRVICKCRGDGNDPGRLRVIPQQAC